MHARNRGREAGWPLIPPRSGHYGTQIRTHQPFSAGFAPLAAAVPPEPAGNRGPAARPPGLG
jgi:hypothetical protein